MAGKHPIGFRPPEEKRDPPKREKWESYVMDTYDLLREDPSWGPQYNEKLADFLNDMGDRGWKVVQVVPGGQGKLHERIFFQRPKLD